MKTNSKIVVSLTTIPPRFADLGRTLDGILKQSLRPDSIEVTIPRNYRRFPAHNFCLPSVPEGVDLIISDEDLGPASKILPCAKRYRGEQVRIVYCDDDRIPHKSWLQSLVQASNEKPFNAIASCGTDLDRLGITDPVDQILPRATRRRSIVDPVYRFQRLIQVAHGIIRGETLPKPGRNPFSKDGFVDVAEGLGGVLVYPSFFDDLCFDIPKVIWAVDDIWLSGCLERQGIKIWGTSKCKVPTEHHGGQYSALAQSVIEDADRHKANIECIRYMQRTYGIWL